MSNIEKVVIVTQNTWLDGLIEQYNTKEQAKFYINHSGGSFREYLEQHQAYYSALSILKKQIPSKLRYQVIEKSFLPSFLFGSTDLVIVLGRDGLVVNTAKYLTEQPILGVNPDPDRIDGLLLKFNVEEVKSQISSILDSKASVGKITLVQAKTNDGQSIVGVNDIFIGHQSHQSARYTIKIGDKRELHSSSGIVISTGIGSTGWMKSIISNASIISNTYNGNNDNPDNQYNYSWDADRLTFAVREAWKSRNTGNEIICGNIFLGMELIIESHMPSGGVIFSDGMEQDRIEFNSGKTVSINIASHKVKYYKNVF